MKNKKIISLLLTGVITLTALGFTGCKDNMASDNAQATQTEELKKQANAKIGMPNITSFYEKKTLKTIMEQCDKANLITYVYHLNTMTGKYVYEGEAEGYPIPYGTEYTSPSKLSDSSYHDSSVMPQSDPNDLYKAENVNATWIMKIDPKTKQAYPVYCEPEIVVSQYKYPKEQCDPSSLPSDY